MVAFRPGRVLQSADEMLAQLAAREVSLAIDSGNLASGGDRVLAEKVWP